MRRLSQRGPISARYCHDFPVDTTMKGLVRFVSFPFEGGSHPCSTPCSCITNCERIANSERRQKVGASVFSHRSALCIQHDTNHVIKWGLSIWVRYISGGTCVYAYSGNLYFNLRSQSYTLTVEMSYTSSRCRGHLLCVLKRLLFTEFTMSSGCR
jgi:hypothetical protein